MALGDPAVAAEEFRPRVDAAVGIEIQNDWNYASDDPDCKTNQLYATVEPEATLHIIPGLSLFVHGVLEPVQDPSPGDNRTFEDEGLYVEDLFLSYEFGGFAVKGGKFTQNFGIAWDAAPGVYGTDVAEDGYQLSERIGIEAGYTHDFGAGGKHGLTVSSFFLDTSPLYQSIGQSRQPATLGKEDGGVSNTEDFSSFVVAIDGRDIPALAGFRYHLSYAHQAAGETESADERGLAVAVQYGFQLPGDFTLTPLVEYVTLDDAGGVDDQDRTFLTTAAQLQWRGWNAAASYTGRTTDAPNGTRTKDRHVQISAGYAFDFGLAIDAGWLVDKTDGVETKTLGVLFAYKVDL